MHQLRADRVGEAADRELRAAVGRLERDRPVGERGSDLDDGAVVARSHPLQRRHRPVDRAEVGHLGRPLELLRLHVHEGGEDGRHRVVHPDVDRAERALDRLRRGLDLRVVGHIGRQDQCLPTEPLDLPARAVQARFPSRHQANVGAPFGECVGDRPPHAARGAGDDDNFGLAVLAHRSPSHSGAGCSCVIRLLLEPSSGKA